MNYLGEALWQLAFNSGERGLGGGGDLLWRRISRYAVETIK
jgi:hypothetical protein